MLNVSVSKARELTTPEIVEFSNDYTNIYTVAGVIPTKLEDDITSFKNAADALFKVIINGNGKASTELLRNLDKERSRVVSFFKLMLKTWEKSSDPELAKSAKLLKGTFDAHCKNFDRSSYPSKTSLIRSFIIDITENSNLADAAQKIFTRNEVEDMILKNNAFSAQFNENAQNNSRKADISAKREDLILAFINLQQMTNAYYKVSDDKAMYETIFKRAEKLIEKYFVPVAIRKAQRKSKSELAAAVTTVAENNTATTAVVKDSEE
jgi:hypothetical protein